MTDVASQIWTIVDPITCFGAVVTMLGEQLIAGIEFSSKSVLKVRLLRQRLPKQPVEFVAAFRAAHLGLLGLEDRLHLVPNF